jgi:glutamate N-acetyltransferase / amino-acid N-acetyltransferase
MGTPIRPTSGSVVAPQGFRASGVFCDIKRLGTGKGSNKGNKRDLALIVSEVPAAVAGLFTTNQVCAAPVKLCISRLKRGIARAIVVNSGNANACTGIQGERDAEGTAAATALQLGISARDVLVASTGRIGVLMPMENVNRGISQAATILGNSAEHGAQAAEAIMTSDTLAKQVAVEFGFGGKTVRIGGICKGAGMIQPGMSATGKRPSASPLHATMLCFVTTDAAIEHRALQLSLTEAVAKSFNRITVDGDMSTNDTVLALANGLAGNKRLTASDIKRALANASGPAAIFQEALDYVCLQLAKMIVKDGEGVSRFVAVRVSGARSASEAEAAARAVANSALVKTSWCGGDPNWGRVLCALGYSGAKIVEQKVDVGYSLPGSRSIEYALKRGQPTNARFESLCRITAQPEFDLHINLNLGKGSAVIYASDLTEAYVDFNKGDVNNPASLGG